jgi:hypothetical protein
MGGGRQGSALKPIAERENAPVPSALPEKPNVIECKLAKWRSQLLGRNGQEYCKVRYIVAGTLRVPLPPQENVTFSRVLLRHTECAYYFAFPCRSRPIS